LRADYGLYRRLPGIKLGSGIYFWENDPQRALEFAEAAVSNPLLTRGKIRKPFVVGAVIDLGLCLNLLDRAGLAEVEKAYPLLVMANELVSAPLPENKGPDRAARFLDRAVIETLHSTRAAVNKEKRSRGKYPPYDTVRGAFWEGGDLYPNAGFGKKNHIQIAVRNSACIKGYFRPIVV